MEKAGASGSRAAATALGITEKSLTEALPADLFVVGDDGTSLVKIRDYFRHAAASEIERRTWALEKLPLNVEIAA
jgi:hypothetical protein